MKIGVGIIAFEEEEYIKSLLDNWYPYADNIVVMEGAWVSAAKIFGYDTSKDRTKEIVMEYPDPDKKIIFVHMSSSNQVSQLNYCYHHTLRKKPDWYVMSGADEFYHEDDLKDLDDILSHIPKQAISLQIPMRLIWNDFYHYEKQTARRFTKCAYAKNVCDLSRFSNRKKKIIEPVSYNLPVMYHPSYVRVDTSRFKKKVDFRKKDGSSGAMNHYAENGIIYRGTCTKEQWLPRLQKHDRYFLPEALRNHPNANKYWDTEKGSIKWVK